MKHDNDRKPGSMHVEHGMGSGDERLGNLTEETVDPMPTDGEMQEVIERHVKEYAKSRTRKFASWPSDQGGPPGAAEVAAPIASQYPTVAAAPAIDVSRHQATEQPPGASTSASAPTAGSTHIVPVMTAGAENTDPSLRVVKLARSRRQWMGASALLAIALMGFLAWSLLSRDSKVDHANAVASTPSATSAPSAKVPLPSPMPQPSSEASISASASQRPPESKEPQGAPSTSHQTKKPTPGPYPGLDRTPLDAKKTPARPNVAPSARRPAGSEIID